MLHFGAFVANCSVIFTQKMKCVAKLTYCLRNNSTKPTTRVNRVHGATQMLGLECSLLTIAHLSSGLGSISSRLLNNLCHLICNRQSLELKQQHEWLRTRRFDGLIYPSSKCFIPKARDLCNLFLIKHIHPAAIDTFCCCETIRSAFLVAKPAADLEGRIPFRSLLWFEYAGGEKLKLK